VSVLCFLFKNVLYEVLIGNSSIFASTTSVMIRLSLPHIPKHDPAVAVGLPYKNNEGSIFPVVASNEREAAGVASCDSSTTRCFGVDLHVRSFRNQKELAEEQNYN
jgi:hypothetical protein